MGMAGGLTLQDLRKLFELMRRNLIIRLRREVVSERIRQDRIRPSRPQHRIRLSRIRLSRIRPKRMDSRSGVKGKTIRRRLGKL